MNSKKNKENFLTMLPPMLLMLAIATVSRGITREIDWLIVAGSVLACGVTVYYIYILVKDIRSKKKGPM